MSDHEKDHGFDENETGDLEALLAGQPGYASVYLGIMEAEEQGLIGPPLSHRQTAAEDLRARWLHHLIGLRSLRTPVPDRVAESVMGFAQRLLRALKPDLFHLRASSETFDVGSHLAKSLASNLSLNFVSDLELAYELGCQDPETMDSVRAKQLVAALSRARNVTLDRAGATRRKGLIWPKEKPPPVHRVLEAVRMLETGDGPCFSGSPDAQELAATWSRASGRSSGFGGAFELEVVDDPDSQRAFSIGTDMTRALSLAREVAIALEIVEDCHHKEADIGLPRWLRRRHMDARDLDLSQTGIDEPEPLEGLIWSPETRLPPAVAEDLETDSIHIVEETRVRHYHADKNPDCSASQWSMLGAPKVDNMVLLFALAPRAAG
ncbi:hypothetical protein GT755_35345 [Herbidospora sp. NEAU-GS84]|uniref:Uncharacterized protein n=1 Tax=Herbidospora solisilvae TaxID=2696284 RepID=A0A7C9NN82_9ACTN|nr:hypothetical protein [Herbidospora solisilvae]NAS26932.1 hypothetical protein [Herbidospora solisilvae]